MFCLWPLQVHTYRCFPWPPWGYPGWQLFHLYFGIFRHTRESCVSKKLGDLPVQCSLQCQQRKDGPSWAVILFCVLYSPLLKLICHYSSRTSNTMKRAAKRICFPQQVLTLLVAAYPKFLHRFDKVGKASARAGWWRWVWSDGATMLW